MADVLNKTTGLTYPYHKDHRPSVNTSDFDPADWWINPDLTAVAGVNSIYWDISADPIQPLGAAAQAAIDADIAATLLTAAKDSEKARIEDTSPERVLRAIVDTMIDEINTLRALHSLADRTLAQARTAIQNKIDGDI